MLGRSKPATISPSSGMPSWARMSARVRASAVAVSASRGTSRMRVEQRPQQAIIGAEVVAPFADAMRFVDRDQRQRHAVEQPAETVGRRPLRRDIEQVELARAKPLDGRVAVAVGRGQRGGADAERSAERIWSCISAISGEMTSAVPSRASAGKLVAERLARPGRHHRQRVLAGDHPVDHLLLHAAETHRSRTTLFRQSAGGRRRSLRRFRSFFRSRSAACRSHSSA